MNGRLGAVLLGLLVVAGCDHNNLSPWDHFDYPTPPLNWGPASTPIFPSDSVAGDIVGAWFLCRDAACTSIDNDGLLLRGDGTWAEIEASGSSLETGETYCEETSPIRSGTYSWDGTLLRMTSQGSTTSWVMTINGDHASIEIDLTTSLPLVKVTAASSGPCLDDYPTPMP
jgi:hypothetical protein